ncbi:NUDIX hydrolase [Natronobeatus ordinarius]|uniref:NUDIX hydrolase n=1 Tax=Natronobeatus ordinarius TaxID=2963433 RepID=UPI0020CCD086|nr:NUDIX hydrolase [Natronobeatus ordinarius]
MIESDDIAPDVPRVRQTLVLPASTLASLRGWAIDGTGLATLARVRDPDGRIALVRNDWTDGWFLPGGAVEPGETPAGAARREVREETGLEATLEGPLVALEQTYVSETDGDPQFSALQAVYSATADGEIPDASQLGVAEGEIQAARWFETIPGNLHDGDLLRPYL